MNSHCESDTFDIVTVPAPREKYSIFECGFHSFLGQNRTQFGVKFFIFALVYLLLDLGGFVEDPAMPTTLVSDVAKQPGL